MKNLRSQIEQYQMENPVRFHIPAHKGRMTDNLFCGIAPYDITELDFSDNLNMPVDVLREEEERAADVFGVKKTIFTVNGASAAVMAAILATVGENECLLVPSNSHVSCYYGAIHAGAKVVRCSVNDPIVGITLDEITNIINARSDIKTCVITSPTYYGCVAD
jgi:arginine/lysine/ornithine decarboxylase